MNQKLSRRDPFAGVDESAGFVPVDSVVAKRADVRSDLFEPLRTDQGVSARKNAARFDQGEKEHPLRRILPLRQRGSREQGEFFPFHVRKELRLPVEHADLARQRAHQRLVKRIRRETLKINSPHRVPFVFPADLLQVLDQIPPFAQTAVAEKVFLRETPQRLIRGAFRKRFFHGVMQLQDPDEIGIFVCEFPVRVIGRLRLFKRTFARIGDAQECRDHQHLRQNAETFRAHQHFCKMRVERDFRKTPSAFGQTSAPVNRQEVLQRLHAFADQRRADRPAGNGQAAADAVRPSGG